MTKVEKFVQERNEALFSLDRKKIEAYLRKYGEDDGSHLSDTVFWASIHKAICNITNAPPELQEKSKTWLLLHGFSPRDIFSE